MSEHWKSTPKYYCKHCLTYVRDTKLERANHEATGKHQGAVRRALTNLHRTANNEVRERERAKREIDRLNGVVNNTHGKSAGAGDSGASSVGVNAGKEKAERTRQAEQLAALGIALPQQFRGELAMPGEWSVTSTTVVEEDRAKTEDEQVGAKAQGVHKRERTEEQLEHEAAVKGLFKKPRRWGRDARGLAEESEDLDALLSSRLAVKKEEGGGGLEPKDGEVPVQERTGGEGVNEENGLPVVKKEAEAEADPTPDIPAAECKETTLPSIDGSGIKTEDSEAPPETAKVPVVAFKKRKAKNIRQK